MTKHAPGPFRLRQCSIKGFSLIEWGEIAPNVPNRSLQVETEIAQLWAAAPDLLEACQAARLTYLALARNHKQLIEALNSKGWPSEWLTLELNKAMKIEDAIARAEGSHES